MAFHLRKRLGLDGRTVRNWLLAFLTALPCPAVLGQTDTPTQRVPPADRSPAVGPSPQRAKPAVKPPGPVTEETQAALEQLHQAGRHPAQRGSLTFFRWTSGEQPQLAQLGLWGPAATNADLMLVSRFPALEQLSLYETAIDDAGLKVVAELPRLKRIAILPIERYENRRFGPPQWSYPFLPVIGDRPRITGAGLATLAAATRLETIELLDANLTAADLATLSQWPKLGSLSLSVPIDDLAIEQLRRCPRLRDLTLGHRRIDAAEVTRLASLRGLQRLTLIHAVLPAETLAALGKLSTITALELHTCRLTDADLEPLVVAPQVTELSLPRNEIHGPGLRHLASAGIKSLRLEFNELRDETLSTLEPLTTVDELSLNYCLGITNEGLKSGALLRMTHLRALGLRGLKGVTDDAIPVLSQYRHLAHLNIRANGITAAGAVRLQEALPKTTVFR